MICAFTVVSRSTALSPQDGHRAVVRRSGREGFLAMGALGRRANYSWASTRCVALSKVRVNLTAFHLPGRYVHARRSRRAGSTRR